MAMLDVDIMNCIPLLVTKDTDFENLEGPSAETVASVRDAAGKYLPMMTHCQRCRADAVGILGRDDKSLCGELVRIAEHKEWIKKGRPYVAVATYEGLLVNQHLGEADYLQIFGEENGSLKSLEKRLAPPRGLGEKRWEIMGEMLSDCSVLLVSGIGPKPLGVLNNTPLEIVKTSGLIKESLEAIYSGKQIKNIACGDISSCRMTCGENAAGGCC
jgi:nitrogen fixation protein NifB